MLNIIEVSDIHDFLINYLSEIVASITIPFFYGCYRYFQNIKFKKVFGKNIVNDYKLIYARFKLIPVFNQQGQLERYPYIKTIGNIRVSISDPVSFCETRAINYLVRCISENTKYAPEIVSDEDYSGINDISFCSLGAYSNLKSIDVINSKKNKFYSFSNNMNSIINMQTQKKYTIDKDFDYALILRIKSESNPKRTHLCISGIGEWGTSGGSYYLSKNWNKIFNKTLFHSEFGAIIRVKKKSDDSAKLIEILK